MEKKDVQIIEKTNASATRTNRYIEVWSGRGGHKLGYLAFEYLRPGTEEYWTAVIVKTKEEVNTLIDIEYYNDGEMKIWVQDKYWGNLGFEYSSHQSLPVVMRGGSSWSYWAFDGDTSTVAPLKIASYDKNGYMIYYLSDGKGGCVYNNPLLLMEGNSSSYMLAYFCVTPPL